MTRRAALAMIAGGVVLVVVGIVGGFVFADDGDDDAPIATATTSSTSSTVATADAETPEELYTLLEEAFRSGDADTLFARLDRAVLDAYGADQCRGYLDGVEQPELEIDVVAVGEPEVWAFGERDGLAIRVEDAIPVELVQTVDGTASAPQEAHVRRVGDELRWFTDCGDPIEGLG